MIVTLGLWLLVSLRLGSEFTGRGADLWHHDLGLLYREQASFYRGDYPAGEVGPGRAQTGDGYQSDYPPYSFPLAMPWLPPGLGWTAARVWFVCCQLAAIVVVVAFVTSLAGRAEARLRWMLAGGVLAMTGLRADLLFGNYGVLMAALLVGVAWALERGRWGLAGTAWVGSLLKPQMGWLFAVLFLPRRGWRVLVAAALALVALAFVACWWTDVTLLDVVRSKYSSRVSVMMLYPERISLVSVLTTAGLDAGLALPVCSLSGLALAAWVLRAGLREAGTLAQMAFIGVVNRLCTYHNACDDLLLVFALALLGRRAWRGDGRMDWMLFLLLGATLWVPTLALQSTPARVLVVGVWIAVAINLARRSVEERA